MFSCRKLGASPSVEQGRVVIVEGCVRVRLPSLCLVPVPTLDLYYQAPRLLNSGARAFVEHVHYNKAIAQHCAERDVYYYVNSQSYSCFCSWETLKALRWC